MIRLPTTAQSVINQIRNAGFEAWAVGGSVRDLLMKRETKGWDFATNALPERILEIFPDSFYDNRFGTVGVKIYSSARTTDDSPADIYEITTFRSEKEYSDFRHPNVLVWGNSILEDLSRRDLTINAIAYDGKIFTDPYHGRDDLTAKIIRAVGNPQDRFKEDALRIIRTIRISTQLEFMIETDTRKAIEVAAPLLKNISQERIRDELLKILACKHAGDGVLLLKNTGILQIILPEFEAAFAVGQKSPKRHHIYDVGTHSVMALKHTPSDDPVVKLATLLHDIGKVETVNTDVNGIITFHNHEVVGARMIKQISHRLKLSNKQSEKLHTLVRWHQFSVDERQTDSAIRRIIRRIGPENLDDMLALRIGDRLGGGAQETSWRLELFKKRLLEVQKQPFKVSDLRISGYDVMKILDCKPGPIVGKVLGEVFAAVESGKLTNDREKLLAEIPQAYKSVSVNR